MGVARATVVSTPQSIDGRRLGRLSPHGVSLAHSTSPNAGQILDLLHSPRFVDKAPATVYATLLDEGTYHCSIRTMYRILHDRERSSRASQSTPTPEVQKARTLGHGAQSGLVVGTLPSCLGPAKWTYYYLYVILDIYSRYTVGWMLASRENADLAKRLIRDTIEKEDVDAELN